MQLGGVLHLNYSQALPSLDTRGILLPSRLNWTQVCSENFRRRVLTEMFSHIDFSSITADLLCKVYRPDTSAGSQV